ncbi:MAG: beta-N-acetylglucosaminidase domain-containing protein, partial [Ginsengibacter sp.]
EINNESEGILSDYIEVIPGNFDFYFDIRLDKIIPTTYLDRFQNRIGKNIDIHLEFYDKNKMAIDPGIFFEYTDKDVDNSFKGFAFSNYFLIDKFDWARVHGATWDYPFSEGDLPKDCRYIKIFLGLKCSGTMWVDNIDFRLSKWNFTPLERMDSMFGKKYDLSQLLIPTPQFVSNPLHINIKNKKIQIVYQGADSPESRSAIKLLQKRMIGLRPNSTKISKSESEIPAFKGTQIILIKPKPSADSLLNHAFETIINKDQGYFIRREGGRIYLGANTGVGLYYAATTLSQLFDYRNSIIDYADITDYPDFKGRTVELMSYQNRWTLEQNKTLTDSTIEQTLEKRNIDLDKQIKDLDFYAFYKLNELYSYASFTKRWWLPGDFYKLFFKRIGERCAQYGGILNSAVQLNPYYHLNMEEQVDSVTDSLRNLFSIGSDAGFEKIKNVLKPVLDAGVKTVMLCSDDFVPHSGIIRGEYTLFTKSDEEEFTNLAAAQSFLVDRTRKWLDTEYHNIRLEFIPPQYNNRFIDYGRGSAEKYFQDLTRHLDSSVVLVWTGNTIRSISYDLADIRRVTELYKSKPMIFDNTPYARNAEVVNGGYPINYPVRSILCNLFEPFDIQYPKNFSSYLDSRYYSNLGGFGEMNKIKYMTFSDFTWNSKDYNPDFSLFKALLQYVGKDNARVLLEFNDAYYQFVATWGQLRIDKEHNPSFKCGVEQKELAEREIKNMQNAFNSLKSINNDGLKMELKSVMNSKIDAWHKLNKTDVSVDK